MASPISGPSTPANGVGRASTTVTRAPMPWQVAATSEPMKPAPMTTTRALRPGRLEVGPDGQAVVEGAQDVDPGHALGAGQDPGPGPGGHDQAVVVELTPVVTEERPRPGVEGQRTAPEAELEPEGVELVRRVVMDALDVPGAGQHLLGQRGAVVGGVELVADDDHRAGMALVADLLGGAQAGQGGADHDDGRVVVLGVDSPWLQLSPNIVRHCSGVRRRNT